MMTIAKWSSNKEYLTKIKDEYVKIDKDIETDELSYDIPKELNKEVATKLLNEKEVVLK